MNSSNNNISQLSPPHSSLSVSTLSPPPPPPPSLSSPPPSSSSSAYISSQIRALFHIQQFLSHQLHQARQEMDRNDRNDNELEEVIISQQLQQHENRHPSNPTNSNQEILDTGSNNSNSNNNENTHDEDNSSYNNNVNNNNNSSNNNNREIIIDENSITSGNTTVDLQMFAQWLEQALPFIILLLILWIYQHRNSIFIFLWNMVVFLHANQSLKRQVSLKNKRKVGVLVAVVLGLLCHIFFMYVFLRAEEPWRNLVLLPPRLPLSAWNAIWIVMINDFFVRFFTMIAKACIIIAVGHKPPHKRKAQLYTVIEMTSYTYRTLLPIPIWFHYFYLAEDGDSGSGHVFSVLMAGLYLAFKVTNILDKSKQYLAIVKAYISREVPFGRYVSPEQLTEEADMCSICQEKMTSPIVLSCSHIFCEDCVSEWFERERTCPLCRASIFTAGNHSHSDGSTSVLAQIF